MEDFLVNAKIRTERFLNTGILRISDNIIEGIFTFDYAKVMLDGTKMSLILKEYIFDFNPQEKVLKTSIEQTIYEANYTELYIESQLSYILYNASGEWLNLILTNHIKDPYVASRILERLEKFKT